MRSSVRSRLAPPALGFGGAAILSGCTSFGLWRRGDPVGLHQLWALEARRSCRAAPALGVGGGDRAAPGALAVGGRVRGSAFAGAARIGDLVGAVVRGLEFVGLAWAGLHGCLTL